MNIIIKATNMKLTQAIESYVHKRLGGLKKFMKNEAESLKCEVEIGKTSRHHKNGDVFRAEISLYVKPKKLYASSETADLYQSIDEVKDEIERELISTKTKRIDSVRRGGAKIKNRIKNLE